MQDRPQAGWEGVGRAVSGGSRGSEDCLVNDGVDKRDLVTDLETQDQQLSQHNEISATTQLLVARNKHIIIKVHNMQSRGLSP